MSLIPPVREACRFCKHEFTPQERALAANRVNHGLRPVVFPSVVEKVVNGRTLWAHDGCYDDARRTGRVW